MARPNPGRSRRDKPNRDDLAAIFGANLKAARLRAGLTQAQLAEGAGLLQQYVSLVEAGKQNVTLATVQALARVVNRDARMLLARPKARSVGA
jgi:transcriptional regulator with XRE-family HTH domain